MRAGHPAELLRVIDGDTFEARVRVWPGIEITTKVRLRGIDAPELNNPRCAQEQQKGAAARDALQAILNEGDVRVSGVALDKYGGRVLADAPRDRFARLDEPIVQRFIKGQAGEEDLASLRGGQARGRSPEEQLRSRAT